MGLSWGVVCVILRLAVLIQYRSVTDTETHRQTHRQTDRHTTTACTALRITSRGNNQSSIAEILHFFISQEDGYLGFIKSRNIIVDKVWRAKMHYHVKCHQNQSTHTRDIMCFYFSRLWVSASRTFTSQHYAVVAYAIIMCLCVCVCVFHARYFIKMAKPRIMQTMPHDNLRTQGY